MEINRRNFLRLSVVSGAGLLVPATMNASTADAKEFTSLSAAKIAVRPLGKTGLKLPILSMGVMRADNPNLIKAAIKSGVVHFDTANGYQEGKNETMLGKVFKEIPRSSFVVATKVNLGKDVMADDAPQKFLEKFNQSMERLQLDYVEILYLHAIADVAAVKHQPILDVMIKLKEEGRVKHIGVSTHANEPAVIEAAIETGVYEVILTSYNYKQKHVDEVKKAIAKAASHGLGIVAMKTMAGAKGVNCKAALKWALQDKNVCTAIPGYTTFDQFEECLLACTAPKLSKEEKKSLTASIHADNLYCQQCGRCSGQCPKGVPVPDLMRAYMYNYGYNNPSLARELVDDLAITSTPCGDCATCSVTCVSGFDVAQKVQSISRIKDVPVEFLV